MAPPTTSRSARTRRGFRPRHPGEYPTLGWEVLDWTHAHLASPRDERDALLLAEWQAEAVLRFYELDPTTGQRLWNRCHVESVKGAGKALALDTPLPTPTGWTTMEDVAPGDMVLDEAGRPTRVVAVSGIMCGRPCYEVRFDDGSSIIADADHQWLTETRQPARTAVRSTAEIAATLRNRNGKYLSANHSVPLTGPLHLPDAMLPIEPYTLGVWLGDGDSDCARITMGDQDAEALTRELVAVGTPVGERHRTNAAGRYRIGSVGKRGPAGGDSLNAKLRVHGLLGRKHIPAGYLRASYPQRLALLQGLMDTDGYISPTDGACELSLSSHDLAAGAHELILSLGIKAVMREGRMTMAGLDVGPRWRIQFHPPATRPVFRLARKAQHQRVRHARRALSQERRIVSCSPVPTVPVRCIQVAAESSLYLAGRTFIPTHNSPLAAAIVLAEFAGPVRFDGWNADGRPVGRPWGTGGLPAPLIQVAAVSLEQTENTWMALYGFLEANGGRAADELRIDAGRTLLYRRDRADAKVSRVTASARSREGQPLTHAVLDEPQLWDQANHGDDLASAILRNLTKMDGWAHFTGNPPVLGAGTVAEVLGEPAEGALHIARRVSERPGEEWPPERLRPLIAEVYDGIPWIDQERILADVMDRAAHPWGQSLRFFFNLRVDGSTTDSWMPPDLWAERHGEVRLDPREPTFTCVRIGHGHQHAAIVTAQVQGKGGRRVPLNKEGRPVLGEGDRVVLEVRTFEAPEGDWVSITAIETELDGLRKRCPARVLGQVPVGTRGRLRDGHGHGPEIALAGAFTAGTHERFRSKGAIVVDIPSTPERLTPAAETLMQHVTRGVVVHDGDEETARQWANVKAKQMPKGWKPEAIDPSIPIVAPRAAMLALDRALNARRYRPSRVSGI